MSCKNSLELPSFRAECNAVENHEVLSEAKSVLIDLSTSRCSGRDDDLFWDSVNDSEVEVHHLTIKNGLRLRSD